MSVDTITCPSCQTEIPLTAAFEEKLRSHIDAAHKAELEEVKRKVAEDVRIRLSKQTEEQHAALKAELEESKKSCADLRQEMVTVEKARAALEEARASFELEKIKTLNDERAKIKEAARKEAQTALEGRLRELQNELAAREDQVTELKKAETDLVAKQQELAKAEKAFEEEKEQRIKLLRAELKVEAERKASEEAKARFQALEQELSEKTAKVRSLQETEMELRRGKRELEEQKQALELEVARKVDAERDKIRQETSRQKDEQFRLKEAEHTKQIADLKAKLDDAIRKAEAGPQQRQGEVLELTVEADLHQAFPSDEIVPVGKGVRGADVVQKVKNGHGKLCGSIIFESKRTKNWNDAWLAKLKEDQLAEGADVAVLVTEALPKGIESFGMVDNVWVTTPACCIPVTAALRYGLVETDKARVTGEGQNEKMQLLLNYLSGPQFSQRIQMIVDAFTKMQADLVREKKSLTKLWAEREKNLQKVMLNTTGMYGDLAGIVGGAIPKMECLELPYLEGEVDEEPA